MSEHDRGNREARSKQYHIEKIDAHLNKLHDFVRVIDARIIDNEVKIESLETWKKSHSAKHGKEKTGDVNKLWAEQEAQDAQPQPQEVQDQQATPRGHRNLVNPQR